MTVAPESATLKVNGKEMTLEAGGKFTQDFFFETELTLLVERDGHISFTKNVTISANKEQNKHSITLEKENVSALICFFFSIFGSDHV